jgi:hypothetical protein
VEEQSPAGRARRLFWSFDDVSGRDRARSARKGPENGTAPLVSPTRRRRPRFQGPLDAHALLTQAKGNAETRFPVAFAGVLSAQTETGFTLAQAGGEKTALLRAEVRRLESSGRSPMPEGFEERLDPQRMAGVIAYVLGIRYDRARTSTLPGLIEPEDPASGPRTPVAAQTAKIVSWRWRSIAAARLEASSLRFYAPAVTRVNLAAENRGHRPRAACRLCRHSPPSSGAAEASTD